MRSALDLFLMGLPDDAFDSSFELQSDNPTPPLINIGYGEDLTIHELATQVKEVVRFEGKIMWDASKPDGPLVAGFHGRWARSRPAAGARGTVMRYLGSSRKSVGDF